MSDAGESGNIKEDFVEDENKVSIEATCVNLDCVKSEQNEGTLDFEEDSRTTQYRITLEYENMFGEPSHQIKIEEDYDNLIGFLDNAVIMENAMIKLEAVKEEDDGSFNNFHCSKCKGNYKGYCLMCSTLLHILNNNSAFINSESEFDTIPTDILEIRETSRGKGVYLLRTLPVNVTFGPFEDILGIESTVGHSWKVIANKLENIKSGNWMKNIVCAASPSLKNLDIFQIDGNLYFQTNREITEGEELLIYYDDGELQQLDNSIECLYTPQKQEKLPKIFACTMCCLGFGSNKCLMEHKGKCRVEHSRSMKEFVLIECHYCKMWMEKWEHEEYHVAYCLDKYYRMWSGHSEAVNRSDADVEEMEEGDCGTRAGKRRYRGDICSRPKDRRDDLQFNTKDYPCFSVAKHETCVKECTWAERSNNEQAQNAIETNTKSNLQKHLNKHRGIKRFTCDICMKEFTQKVHLKTHIKNKHTDDGGMKDNKCSECAYQTKNKSRFHQHVYKHSGIKEFQCDICMMKFTQKNNLIRHIRNMHIDDRSSKNYKCDICMMKFWQKAYLKTHIRNKHTDDASAKIYKCLECFYRTTRKDHLQNHLLKHKGIKPFQCDICMVKFTEKGGLKMHIKNKHTDDGGVKDYKCLECCYQTNYKSDLRKHLHKYTGNLQRHLNKHRGIKQFTCLICMAKFTKKCNLKVDMKNKHADDGSANDYKCSECSYHTNYKHHYQDHLNMHRGIKPFTCDICMKEFTQKSNLKTHIRNKHTDDGSTKDYKCLECSYNTNYKTNLQKHLNKHKQPHAPIL